MKRLFQKWLSTVLIAALCAGFIVVPDRAVFAEDRPTVDLVAVLVEKSLMESAETVPVREDLKAEFSADMHAITMAERVRRYANDIQAKLPMAKILVIPVDSAEEPWRIQERLTKLYVEGDGAVSTISKLRGLVLIGGVPLPLVTKNNRSFVSLYPYTDFDDPQFVYDGVQDTFVSRETTERPQPEVWHGVIPYPVSWEQYLREPEREEALSAVRRKEGMEAYMTKLQSFKEGYQREARESLAHYLDKNHSFYAKGSYSLFSKKAIFMDLFREFQSVSDFGLAGYAAYLENWDNKSYMRYTREWLARLQGNALGGNLLSGVQVPGRNPDGSTMTSEQELEKATADIRANPQLAEADKERQIRALRENASGEKDMASRLGGGQKAVVPDIFTRDPIESFLYTPIEVFGAVVGKQAGYFQNTGRWSLTGEAGDRDAFTIYKIVQMLDETGRKEILEVNTALEDEVDSLLKKAAEESLHLQLDMPTLPINYFGRMTSVLYKAPKEFTNLGDIFNSLGGGAEYAPGHWFYLDLKPTPPEGTKRTFAFDAQEFLTTAQTREGASRYVPYTGQKYTEIVHHMHPERQNDLARMLACTQSSWQNWGWGLGPVTGLIGTVFAGNTKEKECTMFFDNPSPAQVKYIELYDPKNSAIPADKQVEVYRYQTTVALREYLQSTAQPDPAHVSRQIILIGDMPLYADWGNLLLKQPIAWQKLIERLAKHEKYLTDWNKEFLQFRVIVHVVDMPFTAEQCSIYLGGAPETAEVAGETYPVYLRGGQASDPAREAANSWEQSSGNTSLTQNSPAWREDKVQRQVQLSLSTQQQRIRAKEMEIEYVQDNPPRGDNVTAEQMEAWRERLRKLKQEKTQMERVRDAARTMFTQIWGMYYGAEEGDQGRFGAYLEHIGTMAEEAKLAKQVEANRLYNKSPDAMLRVKNPDADTPEQRTDNAALLDPRWFGFDDLRLDKRPEAYSFPDWFDFSRNGYWGGCSAQNLGRVQDSARTTAYTGLRAEMQGILEQIRQRHVQNLRSKDKGAVDWIKFIQPLVFVGAGLADAQESQAYYQTVSLYNQSLHSLLERMLGEDSYRPSKDAVDPVESTIAVYKEMLDLEKTLLLRDLSQGEYDALRLDLRAIVAKGTRELTALERTWAKALGRSPEDRKRGEDRVTISPSVYGVNAPAKEFALTDPSVREEARAMLLDLVQAEYEMRLIRMQKVTPATRGALADFGGRSLSAAYGAVQALDGEIQRILAATTVYEALTFVGITCDPQRAMEPIFDRAGGTTLRDPDYIPLRTTERTVTIRDVNTLAPAILSGEETWTRPSKPDDLFAPTETYTAPKTPTAEQNTVPGWREPVRQERLVAYPSEDNASDTQVYYDDYPRTRGEILADPLAQANSYEQGWQYTRKGFVVEENQPKGPEKALNGSLPPETGYLACLRYAQYGMPEKVVLGEQPQDLNRPAPVTEGALDGPASPINNNQPSGWNLVNRLIQSGVGSVPFLIKNAPASLVDQNLLVEYMKEFARRADSEAGNWRDFPRPQDAFEMTSLIPFEYKGKWDFSFDYVAQGTDALEKFFQEALRGDTMDVNDPSGRRNLYSIYGVRRVATVVTHKEPTYETIAEQLKSMSATSLPVNNPRYVDFYLYEPLPRFNRFGEVEKWDEYEEHISIPYVNFFRAFPEQKAFSYALDQDREQLSRDLEAVASRIDDVVTGFHHYLVDYVAKTSLSGPKETIAAQALRVDTSSIGDPEVKKQVEEMAGRVLSRLGNGSVSPEEMQSILQQSLAGGVKSTTALTPTKLENIGLDTARWNAVLARTSLAEGDGDKATNAKKRLAFHMYWQHLSLAEKYKFVLHNYLTSNPSEVAIDLDFWQQTTQYTAPVEREQRVGFEAGTLILESATADAMQVPLESLTGTDDLQGEPLSLAVPTGHQRAPQEMEPCDATYAGFGGSKFGVPLQNWLPAVGCWAINLWPLRDTAEENAMSFAQWGKATSREGERFAQQTGRFVEDIGKTGQALAQGTELLVRGAGAVLDTTGKWLGDLDQDGLSSVLQPLDTNGFSADAVGSQGENTPNGFLDGQDAVKKLQFFTGRDAVLVPEAGTPTLPGAASTAVIPFGSNQALEVHVALQDAAGRPLLANQFDFVRLDIHPEDVGKSVVSLAPAEQVQRVRDGMATFRIFARNSSRSFGSTRVTATLLRQALPNSSQTPAKVEEVSATLQITVTPEVLSGALYRLPCTAEERTAGTCARGDVRSSDVDSIFSTNEEAHLLTLIASDMSKEKSVVQRSGALQLRYYKDAPEAANLYKKAMGGREFISARLEEGAYAAALAIPKESGKYFLEVVPEASLGLAPQLVSFMVVDTTYSTMRLEMDPPVAVAGQTVKIRPVFTNAAGEEVRVGLGMATVGLPKKTGLDLSGLLVFDTMPGGDTESHVSLDLSAGGNAPLELTIPETGDREPYTLDFLLSKIAPLSQITEQAGSLDAALTQRLVTRVPLTVYPKGALTLRAALPDGNTRVQLPVLAEGETTCMDGPTYNGARLFTVVVELRDRSGRLVPYDGPLAVTAKDMSLFTALAGEVTMRGGRGELMVTPARKSGTTDILITDDAKQMDAATFRVTLTPGPLAALSFSTKQVHPLEAASEGGPSPQSFAALRYTGMDICGNPVAKDDTSRIALDVTPAVGDGTLLRLHAMTEEAGATLVPAQVRQQSGTETSMLTQQLVEGRGSVALEAVNFRGEVRVTVRALDVDAAGRGVIKTEVTPDTVRIPVRLTLRKELLESLEPNMLYTNLLGGPYGDVTQKDFLGGWWMHTGKTQVVTTSTVAKEIPANLARVLPNGALALANTTGSTGMQLFAEPVLEADKPFTVDIKDQNDGKTLMQVRYNIVPFPSGALFENTPEELAPEETSALAPGIYVVPAPSVQTKKDLLGSNRSIIRLFAPDQGGVLTERAIIGDNLQFFRGVSRKALPTVAMDLERQDVLLLRVADGETNQTLATLMVKLDPQRVFPAEGDYEQDMLLGMDRVRSAAVQAGNVTAGAGSLSYGEEVRSVLTQAEALVPNLLRRGVMQYVRQTLSNLSSLQGLPNGVFAYLHKDSLLRLDGEGESLGLYVGTKLLFPLRNISARLLEAQTWLGNNLLRYNLDVSPASMYVYGDVIAVDAPQNRIRAVRMIPVYGAAPVTWQEGGEPGAALQWILRDGRATEYGYRQMGGGIQVQRPTRGTLVQTNFEAPCALPEAQENVPVAGILAGGQTYTCFDGYSWERTMVTDQGTSRLFYVLREQREGTSRRIAEAMLVLGSSRALRVMASGPGERDLFSPDHQAMYLRFEDASHFWQEEQGALVRKDPLPGATQGNTPIVTLTPQRLLQLTEAAASSGQYRLLLAGNTTDVPLVILEEQRGGVWARVATLRLQLKETTPKVQLFASLDAPDPRATQTDMVNVYVQDTALVTQETPTDIRILRPGGGEVATFALQPLRLVSVGGGVTPEVLDLSQDRLTLRLVNSEGREMVRLSARFASEYTRLRRLAPATTLPTTMETVPGLYVEDGTSLLRMDHGIDRTSSRLFFGFEPLAQVEKMGGQRMIREDIMTNALKTTPTPEGVLGFSLSLHGVPVADLYYRMATLPFDLRMLTYAQENSQIQVPAETREATMPLLRPTRVTQTIPVLRSIGTFVQLGSVQDSLTRLNTALKKTTLRMPVTVSPEGVLQTALVAEQRDTKEEKRLVEMTYVPYAAAKPVQVLTTDRLGQLQEGLAIRVDAKGENASCPRRDSLSVAGSTQVVRTCMDAEGVRLETEEGAPIARIRHDGSYLVSDDRFTLTVGLFTGGVPQLRYSLSTHTGSVLVNEVALAASPELTNRVQLGTPNLAAQSLGGTYISYVARATTPRGAYTVMQVIPGVPGSGEAMVYCADSTDPARSCSEQISLAPDRFLQIPNASFGFAPETTLKHEDGFIIPSFGLIYTPTATRVATFAFVLRESQLTRANVMLTAGEGTEVVEEGGRQVLRQGDRILARLATATGRLETVSSLQPLSLDPTRVEVELREGDRRVGRLLLQRTFGAEASYTGTASMGRAGLALLQKNPLLVTNHNLEAQSSTVQLAFDTVMTMMADGRVDIALPALARTVLHNDGEDALGLILNTAAERMDLGNLLAAYPLRRMEERLRLASERASETGLETRLQTTTEVDLFGNLVTEFALRKNGTQERLRAAKTRSVYAPTTLRFVPTTGTTILRDVDMPTVTYNPLAFRRTDTGTQYTIQEREGHLFFLSPDVHSFWTGGLGASDTLCRSPIAGLGVAAVLQADGSRLLCDPLHTLRLTFRPEDKVFELVLAAAALPGAPQVDIGMVRLYPGNTTRLRFLTSKGDFAAEDKATDFVSAGIYSAVHEEYTMQGTTLRGTKGDRPLVLSLASANFGALLSTGKVWNGSQDRWSIIPMNEESSAFSLLPRRLPLGFEVQERREVRYTETGAEPWTGTVTAAKVRLTLTDPTPRLALGGEQVGSTGPIFSCTPATPEVTCTTNATGHVVVAQKTAQNTSILNGSYGIPAVVFRTDSQLSLVETGLWNGRVRTDTGVATGITQVTLFDARGSQRAQILYRPALLRGTPTVRVVEPGQLAPTLPMDRSEIHVLLASPQARVLPRGDFFVLAVDEPLADEAGTLLRLENTGLVQMLAKKLQNLEVLSFDGTTATITGSVGQFGLLWTATRSGSKLVLGDLASITYGDRFLVGDRTAPAPRVLAKGDVEMTALKGDVTVVDAPDRLRLMRGDTPLAEVMKTTTKRVLLRGTDLRSTDRLEDSTLDTYFYEEHPTEALIRIGGNPRQSGTNQAVTPFETVTILSAGAALPTLETAGQAFILPRDASVEVIREGNRILVRRSGKDLLRLDAQTLRVETLDPLLVTWDRASTTLVETSVADLREVALARLRIQQGHPDLLASASLVASFRRTTTTTPVLVQKSLGETRSLDLPEGTVHFFGTRLAGEVAGGLRLTVQRDADLDPAPDVVVQESTRELLRLDPRRLLVVHHATDRTVLKADTLLPNEQTYLLQDREQGTLLATLSRLDGRSERYLQASTLPSGTALSTLTAPGMLLEEMTSPVSFASTADGATQVRYGFDTIGTVTSTGELQPKNADWAALTSFARDLRSRIAGVDVELFDAPFARYMVRRNTQGYDHGGVRNSIFVEARSQVGQAPLAWELGTDRPQGLSVLGQTLVRWSSQMLPTLGTSSVVSNLRYLFEPKETGALKFTLTSNDQPLASLFVQTVADPQAGDGQGSNLPAEGTNQTVTSLTEALDMLGGTGLYVQIRSPEKGLLHLAYEPQGDSTNNLYALALRDASLPLLAGDQVNPATVGVEDALEPAAEGLGFGGDYKNMLLFAAGNTVGESTLPYMSEALINLGDPVVSLSIEESDRSNEYFTSDVGELVYSHTGGQIEQMVLYDIDQDGREDVVFTDGTGELLVLRNQGGRPVQWAYLGATFEAPEGIRELLLMRLADKKNLVLALGSPTTAPTVDRTGAEARVQDVFEKSMVELQNTSGRLQRCLQTVPQVGKLSDATFGDLDGDGTEELVVVTEKNELKSLRIDTAVDCNLENTTASRYQVTDIDTVGMELDGAPLTAPEGEVPAGFHRLPEGDLYARFNGPLEMTWNPLQSICPQVDPRRTTPVYPKNQVPTSIPANPDMVFEEEPGVEGADTAVTGPEGDLISSLDSRYAGSRGVYYTYQGAGAPLMRMLVAADLPYIRSGGAALIRYHEGFTALAKANPFSCVAGGIGGVGNFLSGVANQFGALTGFLTGPVKSISFQNEASAARVPGQTLFMQKFARDVNGGVIQVGDTLSYYVTIQNNLPGSPTKNIDVADRFQQGTELLTSSVVCLRGKERVPCTPAASRQFGLYVPNMEIRGGETLTISYQAKVVSSPVDLTLQLVDFTFLRDAVARGALVSTGTLFTVVETLINNIQVASVLAKVPNIEKKKAITLSSPALSSSGMMVYFQEGEGFGAEIFRQRPKGSPLAQIPVIGKLLESFGLVWGEDGSLDASAQGDTSAGNAAGGAKSLNTLLSNAFLATDRDQDGLVDMWDEDVQAPALEVGDIARLAKPANGASLALGAIADASKNAATELGAFVSKVDRSLDIVNRELAQTDCQNGGCALVPPSLNTAFLAPKPEFSAPEILDLSSPKGILRNISNQTDYAVFAALTLQPPQFWPGTGTYAEVKTTTMLRVYLSPTLSGRFGLTACVGPYAVGSIDLPLPTGFEPNKNCYTYILPDILGIREFCQDLAAGLSGFLGGLGRMVSSGGYTAARAQRAKSLTGLADTEPAATFAADHFTFRSDRFTGSDGSMTKEVEKFMQDFRSLGNGQGNALPLNIRQPAFPAIIMDWVERQMHEVLAKLTKLPTITLILPDPVTGFTVPRDAANDTLEERRLNQDMTSMDILTDRVQSLSQALKEDATEADAAKRAAAETARRDAERQCSGLADASLCRSPDAVATRLGDMGLAEEFGMVELPQEDRAFTEEEYGALVQSVDARLQEIATLLPTVTEGQGRAGFATQLAALRLAWQNPVGSSPVRDMDRRTRALLAQIRTALDPTYATKQLRILTQKLQEEENRAQLANCDPADPIGCSLLGAETAFAEFMDGVNVQTGTSNRDITRILDVGISSDALLRREVRGFSEVLAIIGSLPFVTIQMQDVIFYYPWLPPDRVSEFLYQLEGTKNQSLENFHGFYEQWAFCFFEPDENGRVNWNKALPPTFTLREGLQTSFAGGTQATQNAGATFQHCLAAARVAEDAYAGIAGIEANIQRIKDYGNVMNSMKEYLQWKTYVMGRLLRIVTTVVNQIVGYVQTQNQILAGWRDSIRSVSQALKTFQVLVDVFSGYQSQCATCQNQQNTDAAQLMDLLGNFIQLEVIPFPKWPDVEIDLSQISMRYQVVIPNIRFIPQQVNLPRFAPIALPNLGPLPQTQLTVLAQTGLALSLPVLPALPQLPRLPELPAFRMPKFPDLPPPPTIPQLSLQVRSLVQTIGKVITLVCLVNRNVLPIAESRVRSHLEAQTNSPQIWPSGRTITTPSFEPTLDRIRLSTQVNVVFDTNRPFGQDTYMWVFQQAARGWNDAVRAIVSPTSYLLSSLPQQLYGTAVGFVNQQVRTYAVDQIRGWLTTNSMSFNQALRSNLTVPVQNFQGAVRASIEEQRRLVEGQTAALPASPRDQADVLKIMAEEDPLAVALIDQLLNMQETLVRTAQESGTADPTAYIQDLQVQRDFLASEASGLPPKMRQMATEKLDRIIEESRTSRTFAQKELDPAALPYVAGWQALQKDLAQREGELKEAEALSMSLATADTFEEFKSVLAKTGLLAEETFDQGPVASLSQQDSRNTEAQRTLDTLAGAVAHEVPMDVRDARLEKEITIPSSARAGAPEVGETGERTASNVGSAGAPLLAQVTAAPAVTQAVEVPTLPQSQAKTTGFGKEEEGSILVELPGDGGLIALTNYIPDPETPVQVALTPLAGNAEHPDVLYTMGREIYVKYNQRTEARERTVQAYTGSDRVRVLGSLADISVPLPRVTGARVTGVDAQSVQVSFTQPWRTRQMNEQGRFIGSEARYVLRVYTDLRGEERGETPVEYILLPVEEESLATAKTSLTQVLSGQEASMPASVREALEREAASLGLPTQRVLLATVRGTTLTTTLPVTGREDPLYMRVVPRVREGNTTVWGIPSERLFAHPQRAQDTMAPLISLPAGEMMTVPVERPLTLTAFAEDTVNDVVAVAWDRDAQRDSNGDGDPANDEDVVCSETTPCAAKPTEMGENSTSKATVPALWAPTLTLTWTPGDLGQRVVRVMARDALGNVSYRDIRLTVVPTEIRIEEYDAVTGQVRGSVYPPQPQVELQLLRLRDQEVSELATPVKIETDAQSRFVIDGVLPGEGTVLFDRTGTVVEGEQQNP